MSEDNFFSLSFIYLFKNASEAAVTNWYQNKMFISNSSETNDLALAFSKWASIHASSK
jgi:hypothetical protein